MVGSSIGWAQAPYVACPTRPDEIAAASIGPDSGRVRIVPGLSCRNRLGAPDVMRGEETQILGALRSHPDLTRGRHVLCLPGTHTKWVVLEDGSVREFLTAPTGELFDLLAQHSILVRDVRDGAGATRKINAAIFARGLAKIERFASVSLLHRIFECRTRRLSGEFSSQDSESFLSGLILGEDVRGAAELLFDGADQVIRIIGAPELARLYSVAVEVCGFRAEVLDGEAAVREGLVLVHQLLSVRQHAHAL
jgi:2-dehydro-3-deoxygalactonokinase